MAPASRPDPVVSRDLLSTVVDEVATGAPATAVIMGALGPQACPTRNDQPTVMSALVHHRLWTDRDESRSEHLQLALGGARCEQDLRDVDLT